MRGFSGLGRAGATILFAFVVVAVFAPWFAPHDPTVRAGPPFSPPSAAHLLGTNDIGQDLLSELIYGARVSLLFGFAGALMASGIGLLVGLSAGYAGGAFDSLLMRIVDVVMVLPFLPLLLVLGTFFGGGVFTEILLIGVVMWAAPARELRAQTLTLRQRDHVQASFAMGAGHRHVLWRHLLPGVAPLVPPQLIRAAKGAILLEASLSFLGLGDPTVRSWGTTLYYANVRSAFLTDAWLWWVLPPGLCIGAVVLGFAFAGAGLEEWSRPVGRLRARSSTRRGGADSDARAGSQPVADTDLSPADYENGLLRVRGLRVTYDDCGSTSAAVRSLDLDVASGEIVAVVGESGSGKTTLVNAILGRIPPPGRRDAGAIIFDGHDLATMAETSLRSLRGGAIALVPQSGLNALHPVVRVREQLVEAIRTQSDTTREDARERASQLLESVGIGRGRHRAFPHELSGGMRQRVLIAMALANRPRLILADEPTTGLDTVVKLEILELLRDAIRESGAAALFVSHDLPAALGIADRVVVMRQGEVVEVVSAARIAGASSHPYTRSLLQILPARDLSAPSTDGAAKPVLRMLGVTRRFAAGAIVAVDNVDLAIDSGEVVGLVGRSGAGKSTLARLIFGLELPDQGSVEFAVDENRTTPADRRSSPNRARQLVMQDPYSALPPHLRVEAILAEPLEIYGDSPESIATAVSESLAAVDLLPAETFRHRFPHQLSGGERQRVALARALIPEPSLVVADEPASLLDTPLRADLVARLGRLRSERGTAVLYITHDIGLAAAVCDRIVVLSDGRVVDEGPTYRVLGQPSHPASRALVAAWRELLAEAAPGSHSSRRP